MSNYEIISQDEFFIRSGVGIVYAERSKVQLRYEWTVVADTKTDLLAFRLAGWLAKREGTTVMVIFDDVEGRDYMYVPC